MLQNGNFKLIFGLFKFSIRANNENIRFSALLRQRSACTLPSAYIGCGQHVLGVNQSSQQPHQLHSSPQLRIRVADHLLYHHVDEEDVLQENPKQTHHHTIRHSFNSAK